MTEPQASTSTFGIDRIVAIAGGALMIIGALLEWFGRNYQAEGEDSFGGLDVPVEFLFDSETVPGEGGLGVGILVALLGVVAIVAGVLPRFRIAALAAGVVAIVLVALYAIQLNDLTDRINEGIEGAQRLGQPSPFGPGGYGVRNVIGVGAILAGLGGVVAALSFVVPYAQRWLATRPEPTSS